jgi:hypothetical protein
MLAPGIHAGIGEDDYNRLPGARSTVLRKLAQTTPLHCRYYEQFGDDGSVAKDGGYLLHMATLEPDRFDKVVGVLPDFGDLRSSTNRAKRDAFTAEHPEMHWVKPEDHAQLKLMREAIYDHPIAQYLLTSSGGCEVTALWTDPETGMACKARYDRVVANFENVVCLADLKRARDASPRGFNRAVADYRLDIQAAHYLAGMDEIYGEALRRFVFLAVEPTRPHAVATYEISGDELAIGRRDWRAALNQYAECSDSNVWRGYFDGITQVRLPAWIRGGVNEEGLI